MQKNKKTLRNFVQVIAGIFIFIGLALATTTINENEVTTTGNGSFYKIFVQDWTNLTSDDITEGSTNYFQNISWNQSAADLLYAVLGSGNASWNQSFANTLYADIGVTGGNASWNQSAADLLYAILGSGNASWNQSFADSLYAGIEYDYNQSLETFNLWNTTWDNSYLNIWNYNQSTAVYDMYNSIWSGGNSSWNQSFANTLYADIGVTGGNASWNQSFANTLYADIVVTGDNVTWNQSGADLLYATLGSGNASWNQSYAESLFVNKSGDYMTGNLTTANWFNGKFNWVSANDWNNFDGSTLTFNESKLATTYYNATQSDAVVGTIDGGTLANTQHPDGNYDGVSFNFSEDAGSPALDLRINFTDVSGFNKGYIRYKTSLLSGDSLVIQLWDYDNSEWEGGYGYLFETENFLQYTNDVLDSGSHLQDGIIQMRLYKLANGNTNNHYYVDMLAVVDGYATPSGNVDLSPYAKLNDSEQNITADTYFGDGSKLTNVAGGNASWNQSFANTLYFPIGLNITNQSFYWDTYDSANSTQFEDSNGILNIITGAGRWLWDEIDAWLATKDTDDLTQGSSNLYDNQTWNQSGADLLYATLGSSGNASWNQSYANELYIGVGNTTVLETYNATYDAYKTNVSLNYTKLTYDAYDIRWNGGNASWNQSYANSLYSDIEWNYNFSLATFTMWNTTWDNSFMNIWNYNQSLATYDMWNAVWSGGNASWNQSYANSLYADISIVDTVIDSTNLSYINKTNVFTENQNFSNNNITNINYVKFENGGYVYDNGTALILGKA